MEYRSLGNTGMKVSRMGLGGTALGSIYGDTCREELVRVVRRALDGDINYLDTAPWYGNGTSEKVFGQALEGVPREKYFMATKAGRYSPDVAHMFDFSAERTLTSIDESLGRLGLQYVDVIQVHDVEFAPNADIVVNETLPALQKVKDAGKARLIGLTGYSISTLKDIVERSTVQIDTVLSYCHLCMHDSSLLDHLEFFKDRGIGVINGSPLSMGLLTHRGPPAWHPASQEIKDACANTAKLCQDRGVDLPRLAMDYAYCHPAIPTTLTSVDKVSLLENNFDLLNAGLTKAEVTIREEVMDRYLKPLGNASWEGVEVSKYRRKLGNLREKSL